MQIISDKLRNMNNVLLTGDYNMDLIKLKQVKYVDGFLKSFISNVYFPKITLAKAKLIFFKCLTILLMPNVV